MKHLHSIILPLLLVICSSAFAQYDLVVAKDGSGNHTTVQAAINAAPTGLTAPYKIFIKDGTYKEKITVPSNKPFIQLIGESVANTILTYDDYSGKAMPGGGFYGTSTSASVTVNATDFSAINITFENTTGEQPQALAINVNADRAAFKNCRFLGGQDTLLANGNGNRQYFLNCYIDGQIDFIFGSAIAIFDSCYVYAKTRYSGTGNSYITAANTPSGQAYGYVFRDCILPANRGVTNYWLGRPWQNDASTADAAKAHNKTVFLNSVMTNNINPDGWAVWNSGTNTSLITYAEYKTKRFNGVLIDVSQRVSWSQQLTDVQAAAYYVNSNMFGTWDPCTAFAGFCSYAPKPIAIANFSSVKYPTNLNDTIRWNISWPMAGIKYELFRSSDSSNYSKIYEVIADTDSLINFDYIDTIPAPATKFHYYVIASKTGLVSDTTSTLTLSSVPTITVTGSLGNFLQGVGLPSATQAYNVSASNLFTGITIQAPAPYEISNDNGTTWYNSTTPLVLPATLGIVSNTTISVRLNSATAGIFNGMITHTSTGADTVKLAVNGTVQADPLPISESLIYYPFNIDNSDSSQFRAAGVLTATPTLNKLYVANGTTVPAVPAYSPLHGMAYGATANGDGSWGTASGGPGGNLNRTYYTQFTITADAGYSVRVDSVLLKHAFHNTSSNTKLAVVYSLSGFASDSANITGGIGPNGSALTSAANGSYEFPILVGNQTAGTTNSYRLALNGATGVTIPAGQTLTVRFYNSCGSSSTGRYGKLKDVMFKGLAASTLPVQFEAVKASRKDKQVIVEWKTAAEVNIKEYMVEKSNGTSFTAIGTVAAQNNSFNNYSLIDATPFSGVNYYRVKAIEADGRFRYSQVVTVSFAAGVGSIRLTPNPVTNHQINLTINESVKGTYQLRVVDLAGVQLIHRKIEHTGGTASFAVTLPGLLPGLYIVQLLGEREHITQRILIQ